MLEKVWRKGNVLMLFVGMQTDTTSMENSMPAAAAAKSLQSCLTVFDPMDSSPPGSSVHRVL